MFAHHAQTAQSPDHQRPERSSPLDVEVFPQDHSNTKKEGVNRTFKNYAGEGKRIDTILVEAYNKVEETPSTFQ